MSRSTIQMESPDGAMYRRTVEEIKATSTAGGSSTEMGHPDPSESILS